uniref:ANK_REP_REGION domain-containing protein n=1 Tax=Strongyloides venezuelensis TaxID=75913 RepID=A0A0K0F7F8_STRVS
MEYGTAGLQDSVLKAIISNDRSSNLNTISVKKVSNSRKNSVTGESQIFDIDDRAKVNLNQIANISKGLAVKSQKMSYDEFEAMPIKYLKMIMDGDIEKLKTELKENENHINGIYLLNNSYTLLHYTVLFQKEKVLKLLIELGADVNSQSNMGFSPLHLASRNQDYNMIDLLINTYNADKYALDVEGMTYADRLFLAEISNNSEHDNLHAKYREVFKNFNDSSYVSKYSKKNTPVVISKNIKCRSVSQEIRSKKEVDSNGVFRKKTFLYGLNKIMGTATNRVRHRSR